MQEPSLVSNERCALLSHDDGSFFCTSLLAQNIYTTVSSNITLWRFS